MTDTVRYTIKIRQAAVGFKSSVGKETLLSREGKEPEFWMGWVPEPTYWRPTYPWALRRAQRKKARLERHDSRVAAGVTV